MTRTLAKQRHAILVVYLVVIAFWLATIVYRTMLAESDIAVLRHAYTTLDVNGWCIGHFMHYLVLGFLAPHYWRELIAAGFAFEVFEKLVEANVPYVDAKIMHDGVVNGLGVICGAFFSLLPQA